MCIEKESNKTAGNPLAVVSTSVANNSLAFSKSPRSEYNIPVLTCAFVWINSSHTIKIKAVAYRCCMKLPNPGNENEKKATISGWRKCKWVVVNCDKCARLRRAGGISFTERPLFLMRLMCF